jgi:hypothetical protein
VLDGAEVRMAATGSRDHLWFLAGAALLAAVVAVALTLDARGDDGAARATVDDMAAGPAAGGAGPSVSTKMDRVPVGALLPNMAVLPADELGITGSRERRLLRFASVLVNTGDGPLEIRPVEAETCPPRQRYVEQRVYVDGDGDGAYDRRRDRGSVALPGGCMLFHPRHEHWHFDATARYSLTSPADDVPIVERGKVSFCLRDSETHRDATLRHRRSYADCARNRRQGITVGWGDRYDATLDGQTLALPAGLGDGAYCLRLEVDPFDLLRETDEDDNTSAVAVRIGGRQVARDDTTTCSPASTG